MEADTVFFTGPRKVEIAKEQIGPAGPTDLHLETVLTLISTGTEMTGYTGDFPDTSRWAQYVRYPFRPGYSSVARVVETGKQVEGFSCGDLVFSWAHHSTHSIIEAGRATKIPEDIAPSQAVFGTLGQIAINGVRLGEIVLGDSVVIAGVGPVGLLALQAARSSGACPLIALDLSQQRLDMALEHGADACVNGEREDPIEATKRLTGNRMADIVYDVTGNPRFTPVGLRLLKKRGKFVVLGSPRGPVEVDFHNEVHSLGLRIIGAHNLMHSPVETHFNQWTLDRDIELFFELVRSGRMVVDDLVSHRFGWESASKAYELLDSKREKTMGVILEWK
ncbi:MAG: zinc-binding alcohol dehydrogenase [Theionarchaea archaeon]|nr:zinc-binding alcohol dehydrogenase [Theionarchaea archaeon]